MGRASLLKMCVLHKKDEHRLFYEEAFPFHHTCHEEQNGEFDLLKVASL